MAKTSPLVASGYGYSRLLGLVRVALQARISVLVRGHPGVGKSTLAAELAVEMGLPLVDIRLAQRDPVDLAGVHFPDRAAGALVPFPPKWALEARERPAFIFLDEVNAAVTRLHQAAAYQIVLERRVGEVRFHPDTVILAAGNLEEDNAIVASLSTALCNRFAHFILDVDPESWVSWGARARLAPDILAYIGSHPEALYDNSGDVAFPTPRSWEMASRMLAIAEEGDRRALLSACIGAPAAEKFTSYLTIYRKIDAEAIVLRGAAMNFTTGKASEPSFISAAVFAVAHWIYRCERLPDSALPHIVKFLRSPALDAEYQFLFLRYLHELDRGHWARVRQLADFRELAAELVAIRRGASA